MKLGLMNALALGLLFGTYIINNMIINAFNIKIDNTGMNYAFLAMVFWFILHEIIHGIAFYLWDYKRGKKISFGAALEKGVLYCMCKTRISKSNIIVAIIAPLLVIGFITNIIGLLTGNMLLIFLSIFNYSGAAGDISMLYSISKMPKDIQYVDLDDPTSFTILTKSDLSKKKYFALELVDHGKDSKDLVAKTYPTIKISKASWIVLAIFIAIGLFIS